MLMLSLSLSLSHYFEIILAERGRGWQKNLNDSSDRANCNAISYYFLRTVLPWKRGKHVSLSTENSKIQGDALLGPIDRNKLIKYSG